MTENQESAPASAGPRPPLAGVRVIALEQAAAGPFGTHVLADMGADVIKIERPGTGDVIRTWDAAVKGLSSGFVWLNRGKRSLVLDLKSGEGCAVMHRLLADADVLLTNLGPGAAERAGLGYEELHALNPRLIYCAITGYGLDGPYRDVKAYDLLIQGESGLILTTGYPDAPAKVSVPISDIAAGMYAALGIVLALHQRTTTGRGQLIDVSMLESIVSWLGYFPHHFWHQGEEPERVGMRHHYMVPYGPYRARDGKYVNIAVASQANWERFCREVIDRPDLIEDPRFASSPARRTNRDVLEGLVEGLISHRDAADWLERFRVARLPYGEVRSMAEVVTHPQILARGVIQEIDSPVGPLPTIGSPLHLSEGPAALGPLPALGGNSKDILLELGYSPAEVERLVAAGVVHLAPADDA